MCVYFGACCNSQRVVENDDLCFCLCEKKMVRCLVREEKERNVNVVVVLQYRKIKWLCIFLLRGGKLEGKI